MVYNILDKKSKLFLVNQAKFMSVVTVSKMYSTSVNNICRWMKSCERKAGAGRKVTDTELEAKLKEWITI